MTIDQRPAAGMLEDATGLAHVADAASEGGRGPAVAIVSGPFGGRERVVDALVDRIDGDVNRLGGRDADGAQAGLDSDALVVDDAHYLYTRRIGGFDTLDKFLSRVTGRDATVVTAWNRYSWQYLRAVRDVGRLFTRHIHVQPLDAAGLRTVLRSERDEGLPEFVDRGSAGRVGSLTVDTQPVALPMDRCVEIPYPAPNWARLATLVGRDAKRPVEAVVLERLRRESNGNPGVAAALLAQCTRAGEIAPGDIEAPTLDADLGDTEALLLWALVAMESLPREALATYISDGQVTVHIERLRATGLVTVDDEAVRLSPAHVPAAVSELERRGMLW